MEVDENNCMITKRIGGYILFSIDKYKDKMTIISLAVGQNARKRKIGENLLKQALLTGKIFGKDGKGVSVAKLQVNVFNRPAQELYKKFGFLPVQWLNDYYQEEKDDALVMEVRLETLDHAIFFS